MWVRRSLRTRSPVVPTYLPFDMVASERQAPFQPDSVRGQVMQHMCQDALPPPLGSPIHLQAGLAWGLVSKYPWDASQRGRCLQAQHAPPPSLQGCSRPRVPPVCLCLSLYLFDCCPPSESSGHRAPTRSVHICCKSRLSSASPAAARPTDRPGAAPPREGSKIACGA
jgi:hypothetical protein